MTTVPEVRIVSWEYDEEDYPGVVSKIVDAINDLSAGGTKPVDAVSVPDSISPDFYAVILSNSTLAGRDLKSIFEDLAHWEYE